MCESELKSLGEDLLALADEGHIGDAGGEHAVGGLKSAGFERFWKHKALGMFLCLF